MILGKIVGRNPQISAFNAVFVKLHGLKCCIYMGLGVVYIELSVGMRNIINLFKSLNYTYIHEEYKRSITYHIGLNLSLSL